MPYVTFHDGTLLFYQDWGHDFCGFDDYFDGVSLLEPHGFGAAPRDHAFYGVLTHLDHNVGHYSAELKLLDDSGKLIAS